MNCGKPSSVSLVPAFDLFPALPSVSLSSVGSPVSPPLPCQLYMYVGVYVYVYIYMYIYIYIHIYI